jgi:hypothetical protein
MNHLCDSEISNLKSILCDRHLEPWFLPDYDYKVSFSFYFRKKDIQEKVYIFSNTIITRSSGYLYVCVLLLRSRRILSCRFQNTTQPGSRSWNGWTWSMYHCNILVYCIFWLKFRYKQILNWIPESPIAWNRSGIKFNIYLILNILRYCYFQSNIPMFVEVSKVISKPVSTWV